MIEEQVYTLLAGAGLPVQPPRAQTNSPTPVVLYVVTDAVPQVTLDSHTSLVKCMLQVEAYDKTQDSILAMLNTTYNTLHYHTGGGIKVAYCTGQQTSPTEEGHQGTANYVVWASRDAA